MFRKYTKMLIEIRVWSPKSWNAPFESSECDGSLKPVSQYFALLFPHRGIFKIRSAHVFHYTRQSIASFRWKREKWFSSLKFSLQSSSIDDRRSTIVESSRSLFKFFLHDSRLKRNILKEQISLWSLIKKLSIQHMINHGKALCSFFMYTNNHN